MGKDAGLGWPRQSGWEGCRGEYSPLPVTGWEGPAGGQGDCVITGGQEGKPSETGGLGFAEGTTLTTADNGTLLSINSCCQGLASSCLYLRRTYISPEWERVTWAVQVAVLRTFLLKNSVFPVSSYN